MPGRDISFVNNGIYHIFNKTVDKSKIFTDTSHAVLFLELLKYYRSTQSKIRYSRYKELEQKVRISYEKQILIKKYHQVEIFCYCIMPNHFHLLIRQKTKRGIPHFMSLTLNSFTRYYNIKFKRNGQLFFSPFRAVTISTHEQFIHVSRYIHLNLYSSGLISHVNDLFNYPFSSLSGYLKNNNDELIEKKFLLNIFNNDPTRYKKFMTNNAEYQKSLERLKYAEKWV